MKGLNNHSLGQKAMFATIGSILLHTGHARSNLQSRQHGQGKYFTVFVFFQITSSEQF